MIRRQLASLFLLLCYAALVAVCIVQTVGLFGGHDWYWNADSNGFRRVHIGEDGLVMAKCDPAPNATPPFVNSAGDPVDRMAIGRQTGPPMAVTLVKMARRKNPRVSWIFQSQFSVGSTSFGYDNILTEPLMSIDWRDIDELAFEVKGDARFPYRIHLIQIPYIAIVIPAMIYPSLVLFHRMRRRRRRRQGRCVECGYDLRGAVDVVCSECGAANSSANSGEPTHSIEDEDSLGI